MPFYWDEAGFFAPYAYSLVESKLVPDAHRVFPFFFHPPLYYQAIALATLALGWSVAVVRAVGFLAAAFALSGAYWLARAARLPRRVSVWVAIAFLATPVFLSEAGLAQPDLPATGLLLFAFAALARGGLASAALLAAAAVLTNATSAVALPGLAVFVALRSKKRDLVPRVIAVIAPSAIAGLAWLAWVHRFKQVEPAHVADAVNYNLIYLQGPLAVARRLAHRLAQLLAIDGRIPLGLTALAIAAAELRRRKPARFRRLPPLATAIGVAAIGELALLSLFGTTHQRYLLPLVAITLVLSAWGAKAILGAKDRAIAVGCFVMAVAGFASWHSPPTKYAGPEYRSSYRGYVRELETLASRLERSGERVPILTHGPITSSLRDAFLGYVRQGFDTRELGAPDAASPPGQFLVIVDTDLEPVPPISKGCSDHFSSGRFRAWICGPRGPLRNR